jgi:hypothetical protein
VTAPVSEVPVLTVDVARLDRLKRLDGQERLAFTTAHTTPKPLRMINSGS